MMTAVMAEIVSLSGIDHQTPSIGLLKSVGNHNTNGMRYSTWRVRLRKIALPAFPMEVKRLPVTIWKPMMSMVEQMIRIGLMVRSIRTASCVKTSVTSCGKHSPKKKTIPMTMVA